jgi:hypothetical protein
MNMKKLNKKSILFLSNGIERKLSKLEIYLARKLVYKHLTYEYARIEDKNFEMLNRNHAWFKFLVIILINFLKNFFGTIKFSILYFLKYSK